MNNDALVAALGMDALAPVNGYRHAARDEATRRGLCLISEPLSDVVAVSPGACVIVDPIDIRLAFRAEEGQRPGRPNVDVELGARLGDVALQGERAAVLLHRPGAGPLDLVPTHHRRSLAGPSVNPAEAACHPLEWISTTIQRRSAGCSASSTDTATSPPSKASCRHPRIPPAPSEVDRAPQPE